MPPTVQAACCMQVVDVVLHVRLAVSRIVPCPGEADVVMSVSAVVAITLQSIRRFVSGVMQRLVRERLHKVRQRMPVVPDGTEVSGVPVGRCLAAVVRDGMRSHVVLQRRRKVVHRRALPAPGPLLRLEKSPRVRSHPRHQISLANCRSELEIH